MKKKKKKKKELEGAERASESKASVLVKEADVDKATSPSGHGPAVSRGLKGFTEGKPLFDFPELTL